jgi:hypothetical protein
MTAMEIDSVQQQQPEGATAIELNVEVGVDPIDGEERISVLSCERGAGGAWLEYSSTKGPYGICALVEQFGRSQLSTTKTDVPTAINIKNLMEGMDAHKAKPTASFSRATTKNLVISSELAARFLRQRGVEDSIIREFLRDVDAALSTRSGATAL